LSVDDGQAALFGLRGVDQHPLHDAFPSSVAGPAARQPGLHAAWAQKSKQQLARAWSAAQSQRCLDGRLETKGIAEVANDAVLSRAAEAGARGRGRAWKPA
ncbi:MAG: hypothetical protein KBF40_13920, partial [Giesbergeria sp.]|nr:hypothetical protein [Giesbergeria sp.]